MRDSVLAILVVERYYLRIFEPKQLILIQSVE